MALELPVLTELALKGALYAPLAPYEGTPHPLSFYRRAPDASSPDGMSFGEVITLPSDEELGVLFGCSGRVIRRCRAAWNLHRTAPPAGNPALQCALDALVHTSRTELHDQLGRSHVLGYLFSRGLRIPERLVDASLNRLNPRRGMMHPLHPDRRVVRGLVPLSVPGPGYCAGMDGNHHLIHWGIVITGLVDAYSRLIYYYDANTNNRQTTTLRSYVRGTQRVRPGHLPLKQRMDNGTENGGIEALYGAFSDYGLDCTRCMLSQNNVRIERSWYFVNDLTDGYGVIFATLESEGYLETSSPTDLYCLHQVYLPAIQTRLNLGVITHNNHRIRAQRAARERHLRHGLEFVWGRPVELYQRTPRFDAEVADVVEVADALVPLLPSDSPSSHERCPLAYPLFQDLLQQAHHTGVGVVGAAPSEAVTHRNTYIQLRTLVHAELQART